MGHALSDCVQDGANESIACTCCVLDGFLQEQGSYQTLLVWIFIYSSHFASFLTLHAMLAPS